MIIYNNHEINSIYYKDHQIQQAFYGKKLVFDYNNYKSNIKYKNYLLDPIKYRDYIDNSYISSNTGEIQNQNGYKSSNFIEITPNSSIYFYEPINGTYTYHAGALYDEDKNFIKGIRADNADGFYHLNGLNKIDTPSNAKYIRVTSASNGNFPSIYVYTSMPNLTIYKHESNKTYYADNVQSMLSINAKAGDRIITSGYYSNSDFGEATYEIISYDEWYSLLPDDVKLITKNNQYIPTPVDEYGNHTLNNGLVAKLVTQTPDGSYKTTPEQWGAKGNGSTNDVWPFIHMFAQTKTGNIVFKSNATYIMGLTGDSLSTCIDNPYRSWMCGNLLGGQLFYKPIMGDISDVNFIGNNALITIPDGQWGNSGMGIWNFSGNIENLSISNLKFDGKSPTIGFNQKNSNHTLFYSPGSFNTNMNGRFLDLHPRYNQETKEFDKVSINNWTINNNEFKNAGTIKKDKGDYGGDFILLVNPDNLNGLTIEDNKFLFWGRWVFSIDLLGNGERLYNIKFNRNYCRGDNSSEAPIIDGWNWRGLGLIDFESKKCFTNIEMIGNDIEGQGGFAINGNSKITNNIVIKDNHWVHTGGGYPYMFNCYSGYLENITFDNNYLYGSGNRLGIATKDAYIKNNTGGLSFRIDYMFGDIIFDNNISGNITDSILYMNNYKDTSLDYFSNDEDCNFSFKNNTGGIDAVNMLYLNNIHNIVLDIDNNEASNLKINAFGNRSFLFDAKKMVDKGYEFYARGATFISPSCSKTHNPIVGGGIYNVGDICTTSLSDIDVILPNNYYYNLFDDLSKYDNNMKNYLKSKGIKEAGLRCIKSGYLPTAGGYGFRYQDTQFTNNLKVQANAYIFTENSLYLACNDGTLSDTPPTHKLGIETNGTVELIYICELGKVEFFKIS